MKFAGMTAVITGGGQGIGAAIARALADGGASIVVAARNLDRVKTVAESIEQSGGKARAVRTYKLKPGMAYLYNEGDLHSPRRRGPTQLIRIEGMNMDRVKRLRFEAI